MLKKILMIAMLFMIVFIQGCREEIPESVYFRNVSSVGSSNYVVSVNHLQDKAMSNFYTDILIKVDKNDVTFLFGLENQEKVSLHIANSHSWTSLIELLNQQTDKQVDFEKYNETRNKTFIIKCEKNVTFTFKSVVGDLENKTGKLINVKDNSRDFKLAIKKTIK